MGCGWLGPHDLFIFNIANRLEVYAYSRFHLFFDPHEYASSAETGRIVKLFVTAAACAITLMENRVPERGHSCSIGEDAIVSKAILR